MADENGSNWNGIENVFKKVSLYRVVSCKFHFLQARNTHRNKILKDGVEERFTSLTNKLLEAKTHAGYIKVYGELYDFINICSVKKNDLKRFLLWLYERQSHIFEPFRTNHAPSTNLSESWHSSWSNTGMNNLSLLDAAYMDAVESAITEAEINNFIDGSFSGGSGPNQETRNQRQQEKTE